MIEKFAVVSRDASSEFLDLDHTSKSNGATAALAAVSRELDALPPSFDVFLVPSAGTYNCRVIAGTDRVSAHGYAIAITLKRSQYWRDAPPRQDRAISFMNEVPTDIVHIFERHGFIWGGRWYHYDTMHFEYRPELLGLPSSAATGPSKQPAHTQAPQTGCGAPVHLLYAALRRQSPPWIPALGDRLMVGLQTLTLPV